MKFLPFVTATLLVIFVTCEAYMAPRHSPYPPTAYNTYGNLRRQRNYYNFEVEEDDDVTAFKKRQSGSWGPYNRQTYWSNQMERPIDRTFQGAPSFSSPFGDGSEGLTGTAEESEDGGLLRAAMPALVGGVFAVALSSIFQNSLMVNATTNETFPQLFAFPQLIDPYNPPRIVRRDAEGNEIEEEEEDQQQILLHLISDSPCARAKLSCLIGQRVVYFTREQGLLEAFVNPDLPGQSPDTNQQGSLENADYNSAKMQGHTNSLLEDAAPPDSASGEIVPMKYQREVKDFLMRIRESDCMLLPCED